MRLAKAAVAALKAEARVEARRLALAALRGFSARLREVRKERRRAPR